MRNGLDMIVFYHNETTKVNSRFDPFMTPLDPFTLLVAGDLLSAVLLALPLIALYETGILMMFLFCRRKEKDMSAGAGE